MATCSSFKLLFVWSGSLYRDESGACLKACAPITQPEHDYKVLISHRYIHKNLGGRKVSACPKYGYRADRDASTARNIMLHYLAIHNIHV